MSSVPVGRRVSRAPPPPWLWSRSSVPVWRRPAATLPFSHRSTAVVECSSQSGGDRLLLMPQHGTQLLLLWFVEQLQRRAARWPSSRCRWALLREIACGGCGSCGSCGSCDSVPLSWHARQSKHATHLCTGLQNRTNKELSISSSWQPVTMCRNQQTSQTAEIRPEPHWLEFCMEVPSQRHPASKCGQILQCTRASKREANRSNNS